MKVLFPLQNLFSLFIWTCGSLKRANVTGAKCSLIIVDDFTRSTWTQMLQDKTQVVFTIKSFYCMIETQFNVKILMVRFDNGTEFIQ